MKRARTYKPAYEAYRIRESNRLPDNSIRNMVFRLEQWPEVMLYSPACTEDVPVKLSSLRKLKGV